MREYNETGRLFERRVFGVCRWRCEGYLPRYAALELVQKHQPEKETSFARELRARVAQCLGASVATVKFFTTVGENPMDRMHGVDAVLMVGSVTVTLDLTKNPLKNTTKADILVKETDLSDLETIAGRIVRFIASRSGRVNYWRAA